MTTALRGAFSVAYVNRVHPDNFCAVDWNHWRRERCWRRSWKEACGSMWSMEDDNDGRLNEQAYEAILKKFGIQDLRSELTLEKIEFMSPADLMEYRREKGLSPVEVISDTPGDHSPAEEFE